MRTIARADIPDDLLARETVGGALFRHSLHREVADYLRQMIIRGDLAEGEKIPFAAISSALGVSLTPPHGRILRRR